MEGEWGRDHEGLECFHLPLPTPTIPPLTPTPALFKELPKTLHLFVSCVCELIPHTIRCNLLRKVASTSF
jgi:hypothetical protein